MSVRNEVENLEADKSIENEEIVEEGQKEAKKIVINLTGSRENLEEGTGKMMKQNLKQQIQKPRGMWRHMCGKWVQADAHK